MENMFCARCTKGIKFLRQVVKVRMTEREEQRCMLPLEEDLEELFSCQEDRMVEIHKWASKVSCSTFQKTTKRGARKGSWKKRNYQLGSRRLWHGSRRRWPEVMKHATAS